MQKEYRIIGMMSGTSLDGVDLAACRFWFQDKWKYQLLAAQTIVYPTSILNTIKTMQNTNTTFLNYKQQEIQYSQFISNIILTFIQQNQLQNIDTLAIHGHTIFHMPKQKITIQAANLNTIAAIIGIDVIGNFRQLDVMRGGEGAPLAPFGQDIFEGQIFLNFGGIANIGCKQHGWDINYCNLLFNYYAKVIDQQQFDEGGKIGRSGTKKQQIKQWLIANYQNINHNSLGRQGFQQLIYKLGKQFQSYENKDIIATYYEFLAQQIVKSMCEITRSSLRTQAHPIKVVCTGGGSKNNYLIQLIKEYVDSQFQVVVPDSSIIDFKQAIIFAYLGLKFIKRTYNCSTGVGGVLVKGRVK